MTWTFNILKDNEELFYLLEVIKVEGYISLKHGEASVQNKNLSFLNRIEFILNKYKINTTKRVLIKIKLPEELFSKSIEIIRDGKIIKYHIAYSPFDNSKKIVFNLPFFKEQSINLNIDEKTFPIKICIYDKIDIESFFKAFGYVELRFHNIKFLRFVDNYIGSKKWNEMRTNSILFNASPKLMMSAFSALIDSEGSIDHYGHTRRIRVRMKSLDYLEDWRKILNKIGVYAHINKDGDLWNLGISGWEDFDKLKKLGIDLHHSERREKFDKIMETYIRKQISRKSWKDFYIKSLIEAGHPVSVSEFSENLGKSKRVIQHYLAKLDKEGLIKIKRIDNKNLYSVSHNK